MLSAERVAKRSRSGVDSDLEDDNENASVAKRHAKDSDSATAEGPIDDREEVEDADAEKEDAADENDDGGSKFPFPLARVKKIMKIDKDVVALSANAVVLMGHATECFLEFLIMESSKITGMDKRKVVTHKDVVRTVNSLGPLFFLEDALKGSFDEPKTKKTTKKKESNEPENSGGES